MLTYSFENVDGSLYEHIYSCIKADVLSGKLVRDEKLPSKRAFAQNNGVSVITVQNAYEQLMDEGYIYAIPKKGYYVSGVGHISAEGEKKAGRNIRNKIVTDRKPHFTTDLSNNITDISKFPFSVWAKLLRNVISDMSSELMTPAPTGGVRELREAIADHLKSFRGVDTDPDRIIVGAGTEYLYGLLIQLLGRDRIYCIEDPGYKKLARIYEESGIDCRYAKLDDSGISTSKLYALGADIAHISPTHHFPTGISMPLQRRLEILEWANSGEDRYIIEDDYDSEFRQNGKPLLPLIGMQGSDRVIYMNTFSKSLTPTIRISYMVLPAELAQLFYDRLSFYSSTVSNFEQYTLAEFIRKGYFEKHINRMRLHYRRQRDAIFKVLGQCTVSDRCEIIENDSGLHFILKLDTAKSDAEIKAALAEHDININALSDYYLSKAPEALHRFIINYSNITADELAAALNVLAESM